mgnify:CR=1 FL=1
MIDSRLVEKIESLKNSFTADVVKQRISEFKKNGESSSDVIYKELCYCILTANFNAERAIRIHRQIGDGFLTLDQGELYLKLKSLGHRFPNKAEYIVAARRYSGILKEIIESASSEMELREWLDKNIRGLGYKEASHFLRNIGYRNLAIIDSHIVQLLKKHKMISDMKTLTRKKYLELEGLLKRIADKSHLNLAELDLFLWYLETGRILR